MAQQPHQRSDRAPVGHQVHTQHAGLAVDHGHQARAGAQQRGLASSVGSLQQHDLAGCDVEVDAGQRGKATEQADRGAESDDGVHEHHKRYRRHCGNDEPRTVSVWRWGRAWPTDHVA